MVGGVLCGGWWSVVWWLVECCVVVAQVLCGGWWSVVWWLVECFGVMFRVEALCHVGFLALVGSLYESWPRGCERLQRVLHAGFCDDYVVVCVDCCVWLEEHKVASEVSVVRW